MGRKYEYYLESYITNIKLNNPISTLERYAFLFFSEDIPKDKYEKIRLSLSDESDIPERFNVLLDFSNSLELTYQNLPYENPYNELILDRFRQYGKLRDEFLNTAKVSVSNVKANFENYYKYVYSLLLLEQSVNDIFSYKNKDTLFQSKTLDLNEFKKEAQGICAKCMNTSIRTDIELYKNRFEGIMLSHNYAFTLNPDKSVTWSNGRKSINVKYNIYLAMSDKELIGSQVIRNNLKRGKKKRTHTVGYTNPSSKGILVYMILLVYDAEYVYSRNFFKSQINNVITYKKTETIDVNIPFLKNNPIALTYKNILEKFIVKCYNKVNNSKEKIKYVRHNLKDLKKREFLINYIYNQLTDLQVGFIAEEMLIIKDVIKFYRSKHNFSYYPPTLPRIIKYKVTLNKTFNSFYTYCSKNGFTTHEKNLVSVYLKHRLTYVISTLALGNIKKETIQRKVKKILSSNNLVKLPDYTKSNIITDLGNLTIKKLDNYLIKIQKYAKK